MVRLGAKLGIVLLLLVTAGGARAAAPILPSLSSVVERVMPAVVNVSVAMRESVLAESGDGDSDSPDDVLRRLLPPDGSADDGHRAHERGVTALGSGFIIDPMGFVVTNSHLVADADRITVITQDNMRYSARIVGRDEVSDIAVLKIDAPAPLPYVRWADSDKAKVGDWVVAIGNPFGLGGTVTAGILSARGRDIDEGPYDDFLQVDAPINRGNSGGPTFDLEGQVLGINTAIFTPSGGSIGIGFAIPAAFASRVVRQLIATGTVAHGWIGVSIQNVTPSIAKSFAIDPADPVGALVDDVTHDGPAARAGLRQGDVVLAVDGRRIGVAHDLRRFVDDAAIGGRVMLTVRRDGRDYRIAAVVAAAPAPEAIAAAETAGEGSSEPPPPHETLGLDLNAITPDLRRRLDLPHSVDGVFVAGVSSGSPAATLGLQPGDIIVSVSRKKVATPEDVTDRLNQAIDGGQVLVLVNRHGSSHFLGAMREQGRLIDVP